MFFQVVVFHVITDFEQNKSSFQLFVFFGGAFSFAGSVQKSEQEIKPLHYFKNILKKMKNPQTNKKKRSHFVKPFFFLKHAVLLKTVALKKPVGCFA